MSTPYKKTVRAQFWLTPELDKRLEQVLATHERGYTRAELIRDALRRYLDQESEVLGSKAHQTKTFQKHVEVLQTQLGAMEQRLTALQQTHLQLSLLVYSILVGHVRGVEQQATQNGSPLPQKSVSTQTLLEHALRLAQSGEGRSILAQILGQGDEK
ncbi:hypothetical protein ANRL2_01986 [Anaerolineae bacterium]|nr:hypothetical protein ANRL2_01986 [Anaerolineae bacterium]